MARIIFDSDNTMGLRGCDIDDGLALLYAIGRAALDGHDPQAYVEALCSSYGNNTLEAVHQNTRRILGELSLDLPLYRGAAHAGIGVAYEQDERERLIVADNLRLQEKEAEQSTNSENSGSGKNGKDGATETTSRTVSNPAESAATAPPKTLPNNEESRLPQNTSEAARFIVHAGAQQPDTLSLAVTGSTTNIGQALALDEDALSRYREVVFMGGITETLLVGDRIMNELNLSCDAYATLAALKAAARGANVVVITANNCLPAHFTIEDFERELRLPDQPGGGYLMRTCSYWFNDMKRAYGIDGFCCWDVLVPLFMLRPQLFDAQAYDVVLDPRLLSVGFFEPARAGLPQARITLPRIIDPEAVRKEALSAWHAALEALSSR